MIPLSRKILKSFMFKGDAHGILCQSSGEEPAPSSPGVPVQSLAGEIISHKPCTQPKIKKSLTKKKKSGIQIA